MSVLNDDDLTYAKVRLDETTSFGLEHIEAFTDSLKSSYRPRYERLTVPASLFLDADGMLREAFLGHLSGPAGTDTTGLSGFLPRPPRPRSRTADRLLGLARAAPARQRQAAPAGPIGATPSPMSSSTSSPGLWRGTGLKDLTSTRPALGPADRPGGSRPKAGGADPQRGGPNRTTTGRERRRGSWGVGFRPRRRSSHLAGPSSMTPPCPMRPRYPWA